MNAPAPLPLPIGAVALTAGTSVTLQPNGSPLYATFTQGNYFLGYKGSLKFTCSSSLPFNLGIYGPNPTQIGPPFGHMRAPKINMADGTNNECQGNYTSGIWYLCFRVGDNGAPTVPITITIAQSWWNVFG